jgi:hypothetical protein
MMEEEKEKKGKHYSLAPGYFPIAMHSYTQAMILTCSSLLNIAVLFLECFTIN